MKTLAVERDTLVMLGGTVLSTFLSAVYSIYAGRVLGPGEYADFAAAVSLVMMCRIALAPINGTVARFTAIYSKQNELGKAKTLCRDVGRRTALYGLGVLTVGILLLKPVASILQFRSLLTLLIAFLVVYLTLLISVPRGALRGSMHFGMYSANAILESSLRLLIGILALSLARGATSGLTAYLTALTVALFFSYFQLESIWAGRTLGSVSFKEVAHFSIPMFLMTVISAGFQNVDMLIVKRYMIPTEVGAYGAAFTMAQAVGALATPFATLMLPLLTVTEGKARREAQILTRVSFYYVSLSLIPLALFHFWPKEIAVAIYGRAFVRAGSVLGTLALTRVIAQLCHFLALADAARGKFGFLPIYLLGLLVEMGALLVWHGTLELVVTVMLFVQGTTLLALLVRFIGFRQRCIHI